MVCNKSQLSHISTPLVTYFRDYVNFFLSKSLLLCPEFVVHVGMSMPPGTTIQHSSFVLVIVLRPSAQLAGSGIVRFGLNCQTPYLHGAEEVH